MKGECRPPALSLDKHIPPVNRITHMLQNITLPPNFADINIDFFLGLNSSFESFMQKNSRHLLRKWLC